jgi:hypothetical protein
MGEADLNIRLRVDRGDVSAFNRYAAKIIKTGENVEKAFKKAGISTTHFAKIQKTNAAEIERVKKKIVAATTAQENAEARLNSAIERNYKRGQGLYKRQLSRMVDLTQKGKLRLQQLKEEQALYQRLSALQAQQAAPTSYSMVDDLRAKNTYRARTEQQKYNDELKKAKGINKELGGVVASQERRLQKLQQTTEKTSRSQGILNNKFAKFSIYMSGIAATLFVFQELVSWIGAAAEKLIAFEKAAMSLESSIGSVYRSNLFLNEIQSKTSLKISDAGSAAKELLKAGYSPSEIESKLEKVLEYTYTGFVDVNEAMEVATSDVYGFSEALDYYSQKQKDSSDAFFAYWSNQWDDFIRKLTGSLVDIFRDTKVFFGLIKKSFESLGDGSGKGYLQYLKEYLDERDKKKEDSPTVYPWKTQEAAYKAIFDATGAQVSPYFKHQQEELSRQLNLYERILSVSTSNANDKKIFDRYKREEEYEQIWKEIFAKEVPTTKNEIKYLEQIFKDTGYYNSTLKAYDELKAEHQFRKSIDLAKNVYDHGIPEAGDLIGINLQKITKLFESWEKDMTIISQRGEKYFESTNIISPEYKQYRRDKISREDEIRRKSGMTTEQADISKRIDELNLFKDLNAQLFADNEYMFGRLNEVSTEYYEKQKQKITEERDLWIQAGYDKEAMQQQFIDKMDELNDQYFRTISQGLKSTVKDYQKTTGDTFDHTKKVTRTAINGLEDIWVEFTVKGKASWDKFANAILVDLTRIAFKMALFGNSNGGGIISELFKMVGGVQTSGSGPQVVGIGEKASGGSVSSGGTYLVGEKGPELLTMGRNAGYITPNHALNSDINVTVNNNASGAKVETKRDPMDPRGLIINVLAEDAANQGPYSRALEQTYGLSRSMRRT